LQAQPGGAVKMAQKSPGVSRKRAPARVARGRAANRERAVPAETPATASPKSRSTSMQLAAEIDALRQELKQARALVAELETRVDEDPLTGLLNRRGFARALERSLAFVRRYDATAALLYLDLDGFKPVNDGHGHAAGDWVLGRVGRLIAGNVRASDFVARVGGDELAVLLWNVSEQKAGEKARQLEEMIEAEDFLFGRKNLKVGLSSGMTMLGSEDTVETALARADAAMYARKKARKNDRASS
jgi:diguanylate cyclase (GGDEF)-like protein